MPTITRRRLLGGGATAAAATLLPANVQRAIAAEPAGRGRLEDVEHVVLLMQENRSFDHYFGTLSGVRGFGDPHAARLPDGRSVFEQPDPLNPDGHLLPYRLDTRQTAAQRIPSLSHEWHAQHDCWNGGAMDGWMSAHRAADGDADAPYSMGYFTRDDLPFHYALADAFTICDHYHSSVLGSTHPNRYLWMTGTLDPDGQAGGPALDNNAADGTYTWKTYPERLIEAGVSVGFYHEPGNVTGLHPLEHMAAYANPPAGSPLATLMTARPTGTFEDDARNDRLPTVSWLFPPTPADEHPARLPAAGAQYIASKIDAIAANPDVWRKTVFVLAYDENDGLFDHVAPPTPPAGTAGEFVEGTSPTGVTGDGLPVGLGFRVPCLIVSPWTVGGWVASETFDHTSQLRFLERVTGVREPNISAWRRGAVGDLTSAFRFATSRSSPALPDTQAAYDAAQQQVATLPMPTPPAEQALPEQERGSRRHVG